MKNQLDLIESFQSQYHLSLSHRIIGLSFLAAIIEAIQKCTASRKTILVKKSARRFFRREPSSFNNLEIYTGDVKLKMLLRRQTVDSTIASPTLKHLLAVKK